MPGAGRSGVDVAALGTGIELFTTGGARDFAQSRRKRGEDRVKVGDGGLRTADHQTKATFDTPDPARGAAIDIANALCAQRLCPPDVVLIERIAAIDNDVIRLQQRA